MVTLIVIIELNHSVKVIQKKDICIKSYDGETKLMYFLFEDETKTKSYRDETSDFYDEEMPKVGSNDICLAVTLINFVFDFSSL